MEDELPLPENLVEAYLHVDPTNLEACPFPANLAAHVENKHITLFGIAKLLAAALTDPEDAKRARGISLLSHVIEKLPQQCVNRQETRHFTDFLTSASCLVSECLIETCHGLMALAKLPTFGQGDAIQIAKALFEHLDMPKYHQGTRFYVYSLIDVLLSLHRQALRSMGVEFLKGYCALVEGEKDPRNLKLGFAIDLVILIEFDIQGAEEELFDITFCYFPITFTPPADDPYGISSEELQEALRKALAANPFFGPLALPLILDKLSASSKSAKSQSLDLISLGFPVYGYGIVSEYAKLFWEALSVEVFRATDAMLEEKALKAMQVFLGILYPDSIAEEGQDSEGNDTVMAPAPLKGVAAEMVKNCTEEMKEADKTNAKAAVKIVCAAISASNVLSSFVLERIMPALLSHLKDPERPSLKPAVIEHLSTLFKTINMDQGIQSDSLVAIKDELVSLLVSAANSSTTRKQSLECLAFLFRTRDLLSVEEKSFVISTFDSQLLAEDPEASAAALNGLVDLSFDASKQIASTTVPLLLSRLPADKPVEDATSYKQALNSLAQLCIPAELFDILVIRLVSRLEMSIWMPDSSLFVHHLLVTFRAVLEAKIKQNSGDVAKNADRFIRRLFALFIRPDAGNDYRLASEIGQCLTLFFQSLSELDQQKIVPSIESAFWNNDPKALIGKPSDHFQPFSHPSTKVALVLYCHSYLPLYPSLLSHLDISRVSNFLLREVQDTDQDIVRITASQLMASLVNKASSANIPNFTGLMDQSSHEAYIFALAWIARGLIVKSDEKGYQIIDHLIGLCGDDKGGHSAAKAIGIVGMQDCVLVKENHSIIKLLYKQRYSSSTLKKVVHAYESASESSRSNHVVALAALAKSMPKQLCISEMSKHFLLLLQALENPLTELRLDILSTFLILIKEAPVSISTHSLQLTNTLLDISNPPTHTPTTAQERALALKCLALIPLHIDFLSLQNCKVQTLKTLGACLDDRKKIVRREAVECRAAWFALKA